LFATNEEDKVGKGVMKIFTNTSELSQKLKSYGFTVLRDVEHLSNNAMVALAQKQLDKADLVLLDATSLDWDIAAYFYYATLITKVPTIIIYKYAEVQPDGFKHTWSFETLFASEICDSVDEAIVTLLKWRNALKEEDR